jgi:DNA invertase Pin-like site-specific DNA recombinase
MITSGTDHELSSVGFTIAFAEFERSIIRQRVRAGLKRAVESGKQLGRPKIAPAIERRIREQLRAKRGMLAIAKELVVGTDTVQRIKREMEEARPFVGAVA